MIYLMTNVSAVTVVSADGVAVTVTPEPDATAALDGAGTASTAAGSVFAMRAGGLYDL